MNVRLEHPARRLMMACGLAVALLAPTLACMGEVDFDAIPLPDAPGGDAGEEAGEKPGEGDADAKQKLIGNWKVKPREEDLRQLKIIDTALRPKSNAEMLKKRLGAPPPNKDEIALFEEVRKLGPNDPNVAFLKVMIEMMKGANLKVDADNWYYTFGDDTLVMGWAVDEHSDSTMKITLSNGPGGTEKHTLTFKGSNEVAVHITQPNEQHLVFVRK